MLGVEPSFIFLEKAHGLETFKLKTPRIYRFQRASRLLHLL